MKGIGASDLGRILDPVDVSKEKLLARDEQRAKRQSERQVLTKAMSSHPIPRLLVSRRNDKIPKGVKWGRLSEGCLVPVPWSPRHLEIFKCKWHYLKDRRYRFDHGDVIYTENFDAIPVSEVSAELRVDIEKTPPIILG